MKKFTLLIAFLICTVGFAQQLNRPAKSAQQAVAKSAISKVAKVTRSADNQVARLTEVDAEEVMANRAAQEAARQESLRHSDNPIVAALLQRLESLGNNAGNINDYFTAEEQQILRSHFAGRELQPLSNVNYQAGSTTFVNTNVVSGSPKLNGPAGTRTLQEGNSPEATIVLTHNVSQTITPGDEIACASGTSFRDNNIFRAFDLNAFGLPNGFDATDVEIAIGPVSTPAGFPMTLRIWESTGAAFPNGSLSMLAETTINITNANAESIISVPLAANVAAGTELIFEAEINDDGTDTNFMRFGANLFGQTGPSWILAPDCGAAVITDLATFGLNNAFIMNVVGKEPGGGGGGDPVAYGWESQGLGYGSLDPNDPSAYTTISAGSGTPDFESSGAIDPNDTTTGYVMDNVGRFWSVDVASGAYTFLGNLPIIDAVGMEFNPVDGTLYCMTTSQLFTVDPAGPSSTLVGSLGAVGGLPIALAIDGAGQGYMYDIVDDNFYTVNLATGAASLVGPLGFDGNFGQGMAWDVNTDQVYLAAFNNSIFDAEIRTVNTATGNTTLVGQFLPGSLNQLAWITIPEAGGGGGGGGCATGVYTSRADFNAEAGALPLEDFAGGPGGIAGCGIVISEAGDTCFAPGEILPGIEITASGAPANTTVYVEAGNFGLPFDAVGSNTFVDYTIINFPNGDVNSVGFELYGLIGGSSIEIRIFGAGGQIDTQNVVASDPNGVFFGYIADEPIVRLELEDLSGITAELVAQFAFGECTGGGGGGGCGDFTYVNDAPTGNGVPSQIFADFPDFDCQAVDDVFFTGNDAGEICSLAVTGTYTAGGLPSDPNNTVELVIFNDAGGQPGSVHYSETFPGSVDADGNGSFVLEPTGAPTLNGNTRYWIQVQANMEFGVSGQWFWSSATDGNDDAALWQNPGGGFATCTAWGTFADCGVGGGLGPDLLMDIEMIAVEVITYDDCEGALPIGCGESVLGDTIGATDDSAVAPDCDTPTTTPGVWYKFEDTSGLASTITLTTCSANTDYDTKISVYTGECNNPPLTCVAGNDDDPSCPAFQSTVQFTTDGSPTTYYILVHGFGGQTGNFELTMTCECFTPPNDDIANAVNLNDAGCPFTDENVATPCASEEAGTPAGCDISGANGVWYVFTPEIDGEITGTIGTPGGAPGTYLTVNNGPLAGNYNPVAASFGGAIPNSPLTADGMVVIDDDVTGDANDACDPILNGADLSGKIALIRRGSCEFGFKALAAQNEGAVAVVVVNNQPGDPIVMGGGAVGEQVIIPVVMISDVEGEPIITEVLGGNTVNMTLVADFPSVSSITFYTAPDETSTEDELVWVDYWQNQCLPSESATIPVVAGQTYYCFVVNTGAVTDIIFDNCQLGVDSNEIEGFVFYPNPTNDKLNLSATQNIEKVAIYNILGQRVIDMNVEATQTQVSVAHLAAGAYIMEVMVDGQKGTYKVIKN